VVLKNIFSVGVAKFNVDNLNNNELIEHCKNTYNPTHKWLNFDNTILNPLKSLFLSQGQVVLKELLGTTETHILQIDRIWGNMNVDESIMIPHTHKSSLLSAVYYLTPGKLTFLNPFHVTLAHVNQNHIVEYNEYNSDHRFIEMQKGDMIIFNSQIYHFAAVTRDERISIACDMSVVNNKPNPRDKI
jgi:uncharacterized protein (TIGR02466 family)